MPSQQCPPALHAQVFYNPDMTPLRGRPEVFMRGSFNRWNHSQCFMPVLMQPVLPGGIGFLQATVQVWCAGGRAGVLVVGWGGS